MVIYPESFSVKPNTEATVSFRNLFNTTAQAAVRKNLTLPKGSYVFLSKNAAEKELFISNTVGEGDSEKNIHKVAVVMDGVKDMEIDGNDSVFIMDGKMTYLMLKNCENITIKNLTIETVMPNVHKVTVIKASPFYVTVEIDGDGRFFEEFGKFFWKGTDYEFSLTEFSDKAFKTPTAFKENYNHLKENSHHPFYGAASIRRIGDRTFNIRFILPKDYKEGQVFYLYPHKKDEVGIFIDSSKNIKLENVRQHQNNGIALVAQDSENLYFENMDFSPNPDNEADLCSGADFMRFSMCRGKISVKESVFSGSGGSACRVNGTYFKIVKSNKDKLTLKFPNRKICGFPCIREGDSIAFIDPETLIEVGRTKVISAVLRDKYYYDIITAGCEAPLGVKGVVENISANPDFEFSGNTVNRVVGNGVSVTTRGKIRIEENKFLNTGAEAVFVGDDADSRFESGYVTDAKIKGNAFMNCDENAILIKPEPQRYQGPVHKNILIEHNLFVINNTHALTAFYCDNIEMQGNTYAGEPKYNDWVILKKVTDFKTDEPK